MKKFARHPATHNLALRVQEVDQLFNSLDPTPFLNKDIDPEAENFIESWAAEFPAGSNFHITVHVEQWPSDNDPNKLVSAAIHNHFAYQAVRTRKKLHRLLRQGRMSMLIGIVFVTLCLLAAEAIGSFGDNASIGIARESLTIIGWVAMWRPLQIFLYDWWPIRRQIRLYQKLGSAQVKVIQGK